VLVVDDDPITREVLETSLRDSGFGVLSVSSGEGALLSLCQLGDRIDWLVTRVSPPAWWMHGFWPMSTTNIKQGDR
jgi:CheY-like chemotaxis protein